MGIRVYRDGWGIPHLAADTADELAFAQGRSTAIDRAWQIEVERHRADGTTAAFLGADAVGWDIFARLARLDDTARRCFRRLDAATAAWVSSYVDGVNAGLVEGAERAPEFRATGLAPGRWRPWTPLGIWLSTHILFAGFPTKLWREEVARRLGDVMIDVFATDGPGTMGSNGWIVGGDRTVTGTTLLAGDPHRFLEAPGVYQQVHLACPEYDVVGLAVPGVPGLPHFGHTGRVAWSITNAMADYQDLYAERLSRCGAGVQALGPGGWRDAAVHLERIDVQDGDPVNVEVIETERGPVVIGGPNESEAVSLRYPSRVIGELGFDALPTLLRAGSVTDVDRAFDRWVEPVNVVQASDTDDGMLHRTAGRVPLRQRDNMLRVVPAWESQHQWHGWHAPMPRAAVDGIAVMANARELAEPLGIEFAAPHRAERIRYLLQQSTNWSGPDMAAVHTDTHLASARPLLELVRRLDGLSPDAARLRYRLLRWDQRMAADSTDATAYAALRTAVVRRLAEHPKLSVLTGPMSYAAVFQPWLALIPRIGYALEGLLTTDKLPGIDRAKIGRQAMEDVATGNALSREEPLPWEQTHRLAPWQALPDADHTWPGMAGDHDCVLGTSSIPGVTDRCVRGPVARYVWDLARREDSLWVVPLGASGVPSDDHYQDQMPLWVRGKLLPVVTDWNRLTLSEKDGLRLQSEAKRQMASCEPDASTPRPAVHQQVVDGFGTVRLVPVNPVDDLELIYGWVTQERAHFWGMREHSRKHVQEIYDYLDSLDTHHAYLVHRDDQPVALFQTYEPEADPVSEYYPVHPGDVGIHLLVAPVVDAPERGFTGTLLSVLLGFMWTADHQQRIVVEPDTCNDKSITRFLRAGFTLGPEINLPEKRAQLLFLNRGTTETISDTPQ